MKSLRRNALVGLGVAGLAIPGMLQADPGGGMSALAAETLAPIEIQPPQDFGASPIDGLQYADPIEALGLIEAPQANESGTVSLSYPIDVPPGHGITPELAVNYDSSGDNGWMGIGWSLDAPSIEVDTSYGAPHFDLGLESESYLHDGQLLVPNAIGDDWVPRVPGTRRDYTHQVETEFSEIIRHEAGAGGPQNYFWEVRGKDGGVRWYGGTPDSGGPVPSTTTSVPTLDPAAVVRDDNGNIVKWLLSAERDIGVNLIRYEYTTEYYVSSAGAWVDAAACPTTGDDVCGRHTYLDRILYTDATSAIAGFNGPPYEIDLIRATEQGAAHRADPIVDARSGYVDVVVDRLAQIEVKHGAPPASGSVRTYTDTAARYVFGYQTGWFGKTLLATITQGIDDLHVHQLEYFNELGPANTSVDGFGDSASWVTNNDVPSQQYLDQNADVSVLGGSRTDAGSGNIYVGFNPFIASKNLSFGVGIELAGGDTGAIAEWIDLNGDNLPDKVYADSGGVKFRLNTGTINGAGGFTPDASTPAPSAPGLTKLSESSNFSFQVSFQAYPVVAIGVGTGKAFTWSKSYFSDVNADGLVDFVADGVVYFNRLVGGVPTFETSSSGTPVPLDPASLPVVTNDTIQQVEAEFALQSPPIDTVRRFVAPFTGTVSIDAPVALDTVGAGTTDGVRVAIQHNDTEIASAVLDSGLGSAFAAPVVQGVTAGDELFFRVGSIEDGVNDSVDWAPVVTYTSGAAASAAADANGLSQTEYDATADFTLAGRPGSAIGMPFTGTATVTATITVDEAVTDDLEVVVVKNVATLVDNAPTFTPTDVSDPAHVVANGTTGTTVFTLDVPVSSTVATTTLDENDDGELDVVTLSDTLAVSLGVDSPIDVTDLDWSATIEYSSAVDSDGDPIALTDSNGNPIFSEEIAGHVEMYPESTPAEPAVTVSLPSSFTARLAVLALTSDPPATTTAVVTFKNSAGLVKRDVSISSGVPTDFDVDLSSIASGGDYFVDVSIRDNAFSMDGLTLTTLERVTATSTEAIDGRLRWTGFQGIFPLSYRGWALAGYTAADGTTPIDRSAFVLSSDGSDFDDDPEFDDLDSSQSAAAPSYAYIPSVAKDVPAPAGGQTTDLSTVATDRWMLSARASIYGDADTMSTSRLLADSASLTGALAGAPGAGGRSAPTRTGEGGPGVSLMFGVGPFGGSFGWSPSEGITDFEDLNGDGYPDQIAGGSVTYTDQIGGYTTTRTVADTSPVNRDETFSIQGGLDTGLVEIVPNSKGAANANAGGAAARGGSASDAGPSYTLGVSGSGGYSWTSTAADSTNEAQRQALKAEGEANAEVQKGFADVNGDGLADYVYANTVGVFARYNTGYGFTTGSVSLAAGGFEARESASGGFGLGFAIPYGEFGGGVNFLWNYDWSQYSWRDINGDGILDQLRRDGSAVTVAFGTGSGTMTPVSYGTTANTTLAGGGTSDNHIAFDRSSGIGGGVSATFYIGPLCIVACYLVIGGGGGYNNSISSTSIDLQDVNGDGFADVVSSADDNQLDIEFNQQGKTLLLSTVTNPLGGTLAFDYRRDGNTSDHPDSIWTMSSVTIDDGSADVDGRLAADDVSVYRQTFTYSGLRYDRTHRSSLGYRTVTMTEHDHDGTPLRRTESTYLNDNVFAAGLLESAIVSDAGTGLPVRGSSVEWGFRDVQQVPAGFDSHLPVTTVPADQMDQLGDLHSVASRGQSIAPLVRERADFWYDNGAQVFTQNYAYTYDGLGNTLVEVDEGDPLTIGDELTTTIEYSDCVRSTVNGCLAPTVSGTPSPLMSPGTCVNWASYPSHVTLEGVDENFSTVVLRERSGFAAMCDNGAVTQQLVRVDDGGTPVYAETNMVVNAYGDYELVLSPPGDDGVRYLIKNTYDADRHTDIAMVEEFDVDAADAAAVLANGPTAATATAGISSTATFDPLSGRVASRTDANGATRSYSYDGLGRIDSVTNTTSGAEPASTLVDYEYFATASYPYARARHTDILAAGPPAGAPTDSAGGDTSATIDTYTFADGLGRTTQTKRDARIIPRGATAPVSSRQVTGTAYFDALARPVVEFGPVEDLGAASAFSTNAYTGKQTALTFDLAERPTMVVEPGNRVTTTSYTYEVPGTGGSEQLVVTDTDPEGRVTITKADRRANQLVHIDVPAPRVDGNGAPVPPPPSIQTTYVNNPVGETVAVIDSTGAVTDYTYDRLGRVRSISTPNAGLTEFDYDLAGRSSTTVNPVMRAAGTRTSYRYTFNRLTEIDHPGVVDDVTYTYGLDNADGRFSAGRVRTIDDRTRIVEHTYADTGAVIAERAEMKRHNWRDDLSEAQREGFRYLTQWSYDEFGRLLTVTYPDNKSVDVVPDAVLVAGLTDPSQLAGELVNVELPGETATYHYDSGGMLQAIDGVEPGIELRAEPINQFIDGVQTVIDVPRLTDHGYDYLVERRYDHRLLTVRDDMGNGTVSTYSINGDTRWLDRKTTTSPIGDGGALVNLQDLTYTYDAVGRPLTYSNQRPFANRAINGGSATQTYSYDGFGRLRGATGSFRLKSTLDQRYTYGVVFEPDAPWSLTQKTQTDTLFTFKPNGRPGSTFIEDASTYSFARELDGPGGPLHVINDDRTDSSGETERYSYDYNVNGAIESMLADDAGGAPTTTAPKGKGKGGPTPASETNEWDRTFTWNSFNQLTSARDGSELRTFAYDDTGRLRIQDGSLLADDGAVIHESGGGPELLFVNEWVFVRSQKIYKHVLAGADKLMAKKDSGPDVETAVFYNHTDLIGSTNIVSDGQGRGFQRHEYFPSGEIWIDDRKEEIRTPFQFANGYYEDEFDIVLFGERWYDTERELFLSPDSVFYEDATALIDQPALGGAYTYGAGNPVGNVDPSGQRFFSAHQKPQVLADAEAKFLATGREGAQETITQGRAMRKEAKETSEKLDTEAIIKIDRDKGEVTVGFPYGPRYPKSTEAPGNDSSDDSDGSGSLDAASADGSPNGGDSPRASQVLDASETDSSDDGDDRRDVDETSPTDQADSVLLDAAANGGGASNDAEQNDPPRRQLETDSKTGE